MAVKEESSARVNIGNLRKICCNDPLPKRLIYKICALLSNKKTTKTGNPKKGSALDQKNMDKNSYNGEPFNKKNIKQQFESLVTVKRCF